jgi:curved DNA-binding protein CbpA
MANYYEILEIHREATHVEVKAAFRALAKKYHPDFHPHKSVWAHDRMHEILRAYEVLVDEQKRAVYDRTLSHWEIQRGSAYRESLKKKMGDPAACCRLIFLDLLEGRGAEALTLYERLLTKRPSFSLGSHMTVGDRLDCTFLLAEEYERQHRSRTAFDHYHRIYRDDLVHNYFRRFRDEILLRMRNLLIQFLSEEGGLPHALRGFSGAVRDAFPRRERAFIYKKMAECFLRAGAGGLARMNLLIALQLNPKIGGIKKIRTKLGMMRKELANHQGQTSTIH